MIHKQSIFLFSSILYCCVVFAEFIPVDNKELQGLMEKQGIAIIDIRTPEEWKKSGIIPGSHKLTFYDKNGQSDPQNWLAAFKQIVGSDDQPFVLVCHGGKRSEAVGRFLNDEIGMKRVYHLQNGIVSWKKEDGPVSK